jgi:hypothetical protein
VLVIAGIILIGSGAASTARESEEAVSAIKKTASSS